MTHGNGFDSRDKWISQPTDRVQIGAMFKGDNKQLPIILSRKLDPFLQSFPPSCLMSTFFFLYELEEENKCSL